MDKSLKPLMYVGLAFLLSIATLAVGADYVDRNRDYSPEIAIARTLIEGGTVSGEFNGFRQTACSGDSITKFFLKQAAADGLDPEKIKRLCKETEMIWPGARR
ncbi:MAG: hypothetical protein V4486_00325 [Patescibacteria group bacterium]